MTILEDIKDMVLPDHDCPGAEDCAIPHVLMLLAYDDPAGEGVSTDMVAHRLDPETIANTIVKMWDGVVANYMNPTIPDFIKFAFGRDLLRKAIEGTPPPDDIAEALKAMSTKDDS